MVFVGAEEEILAERQKLYQALGYSEKGKADAYPKEVRFKDVYTHWWLPQAPAMPRPPLLCLIYGPALHPQVCLNVLFHWKPSMYAHIHVHAHTTCTLCMVM